MKIHCPRCGDILRGYKPPICPTCGAKLLYKSDLSKTIGQRVKLKTHKAKIPQ